jgi:hypothetical protein
MKKIYFTSLILGIILAPQFLFAADSDFFPPPGSPSGTMTGTPSQPASQSTQTQTTSQSNTTQTSQTQTTSSSNNDAFTTPPGSPSGRLIESQGPEQAPTTNTTQTNTTQTNTTPKTTTSAPQTLQTTQSSSNPNNGYFTGSNESYTLLEPLPCIDGFENCKNTGNGLSEITSITVNDYVRYVYKFSLALAVFLATVMIIWGGFQYMISAANPSSKSEAKKRINDAIYGLIAVLISYLILRTIDPRLVLVESELPTICAKGQTKAGQICDPNSIKAFNASFQSALRDASSDKKLQVLELEDKLNEVRRQQLSYDSMKATMPPEDYELRSAELAKDRADLEQQQIVAISQGQGLSSYREAYGMLTGKGEGILGGRDDSRIEPYIAKYTEDWLPNNKLSTQTNNKIANLYNDKINQLDAIEPKSESTNQAIRKLAFERNFYVDEIRTDKEVFDKLNSYTKDQIASLKTNYSEQIKILNSDTYISDVISKDRQLFERVIKIKNDPDLKQQYNVFLQNRLETLNSRPI